MKRFFIYRGSWARSQWRLSCWPPPSASERAPNNGLRFKRPSAEFWLILWISRKQVPRSCRFYVSAQNGVRGLYGMSIELSTNWYAWSFGTEQPRQCRFLKPKAGNGGFLRESAFPAES